MSLLPLVTLDLPNSGVAKGTSASPISYNQINLQCWNYLGTVTISFFNAVDTLCLHHFSYGFGSLQNQLSYILRCWYPESFMDTFVQEAKLICPQNPYVACNSIMKLDGWLLWKPTQWLNGSQSNKKTTMYDKAEPECVREAKTKEIKIDQINQK